MSATKEFKAPVTKRKQKEEEDFPRGGASGLTPLEYKEIAHQADTSLFSEPGSKPSAAAGSEPAKKKRKPTKKTANSEVSFENTFDKKKLNVEILSFKRLTEGTKLLGCISGISHGRDSDLPELIVSLPNNLTGFVDISELSDELIQAAGDTLPDLKEQYFIGQWVQCVIIGLQYGASGGAAASGTDKQRRKIILSLKPFIVNAGVKPVDIAVGTFVSGAVKSVEDHGYIVNLGINGLHGFLKNSEAKMYQRIKNNDKPLTVGQVLTFSVLSMESNKKTVQLTVDAMKVSKALLGDKFSFSEVGSIMPGNVVETHITEIQDIGAVGKFMGHFDATIDYFHTSKGMITSKKEIEETFKVNDKVRARVLYIDLASQPTRIGLSNAKHVMGLTQPNTTESELGSKVFPGKAIPIGRSFETVTIKRIDPRHGLLCSIDGVDIPAYVHISRVADEHLANISATGKFRVDSTHRGVVLGYDPVDGLFQMSLQESMVDQPFLRIEDIIVGSVIKGTVAKVSDKGVIISLAKNIKGFVPLLHCVDSAVTSSTKKHVDEKFKEGKSIKCRVLSTDASEGRVILTCKDSLISSKHPIFTSLDDITPGSLSDGVIVKVNAHGCIVSFFNNVKAFAHISELQETHVNNLNIFQPGQVKTCRVLEVNAAEQNMKVSFKKSSEVDLGSVKVGSIHKGKIITIKKDLIHLTLKPSETRAVIHATHLSDHIGEQADRIFASLKEGMIISDLVVLSKDETRGSVMVTKKPILVLAAKEKKLITERAGLKEGHVYPAFVRQVAKFGVFVEFANGIEALAFRHSLSDASEAAFVRNQSVLAKVLRVDPTDGKTEVSLKPSDVSSSESVVFQGEFLAAFFKQLERLAKKADSTVSVGACTLADVKTVGNDEWTISYGGNKTASVAANQIKEGKTKVGSKCTAKVLDVDFEQDSIDFTLKDSLISAEETKEAKANKFSTANISKDLTSLAALQKALGTVEAVVELVKDDYLVMSIPEVNNMIAFAATRSLNNRKDRFIGYKAGEKVKAIVAYVPKSQGKGQAAERVILSIEQASVSPRNGAAKEAKKGTSSIAEFEDVKEGSIVSARVANIQHTGMDVHLGGKVFGRIHLTNLADTYSPSETLLKNFKKGQLLKCFVLQVDPSNKKIDLSLRPSRLAPQNHAVVHDPEVKGFSDLAAGGILQGYVSNVADKGLFVALNHKLSGRVKIAELSDDYLKDWKSHFTVGQVVKAKIVNVSEAHHQIELTLKASQIDPSIKAIQTLADFTKGEKVKGTIKAVKDIGVFIKIDNSTVSGLCHISEISENHVPDVSKLYAVGDPVKAKILDIDMEKKRISFGLKSSYFEEGDAEVDEDEEDEDIESAEGSDEEMEGASDEEDIEMGEDDSGAENVEESDGEVDNIFAGHDDSDSEDAEEEEAEEEESKVADDDSDVEMTDAAPLAVASGFNWDGKDDAEEDTKSGDSDSDDDSDDERSNKKKKAKKQAAVVQDDTADLESQAPQVASDYERLLLGSPNSSYLWINYMAFQLQLSEISKAREIGQRALKSISFREEQEKMNVWVALMNLENTFGSADTLEEVFKNAVQTCEPKKIYLQLVKIYERSNKIELATELYTTMTKKFGQSSKVWTGFGHFQLHHGNLEAGRELLQRSLKSLPKRKHIKTISKFAQLEFKYGEPERGRTIFEGVMSNYPKRIDLWSVYIDMEVRNGEQDAVRRLFARVVSLKLSSKKMKFFFKKWLAYEKDNGDEESVEEVKRRALAYVESLSA